MDTESISIQLGVLAGMNGLVRDKQAELQEAIRKSLLATTDNEVLFCKYGELGGQIEILKMDLEILQSDLYQKACLFLSGLHKDIVETKELKA